MCFANLEGCLSLGPTCIVVREANFFNWESVNRVLEWFGGVVLRRAMGLFGIMSGLFGLSRPLSLRDPGVADDPPESKPFIRAEDVFDPDLPKPFNELPAEIVAEIFSKMDVPTLKSCRQVCPLWTWIIDCEKLFLSRICAVHVAKRRLSQAEYFTPDSKLIATNHLRLRQVYSTKYTDLSNLFQWITAETMKNIVHLDIRNCQLLLPQYMKIVCEFTNITTLTISDKSLIWTQFAGDHLTYTEARNPFWNQYELLLRQITTLNLELTSINLQSMLATFERFNILTFGNLVEVNLRGTCSFQIIAKLVGGNPNLRVFKSEAFPIQLIGQVDRLLAENDLSRRVELLSAFKNFLGSISELELPPDLEILSLNRFPIANMCDPQISRFFYPFLQQFRNLRECHFAVAYFSKDEEFEDFRQALPPSCKIYLTSLHLYQPTVDICNVEEVLQPNLAIVKHANSWAELKFDNMNWRIIYLTWRSLENTIAQKYLHCLNALKLHRLRFPFRDEDLQMIIGGGMELSELVFDHCDLLQVTDSGLTGLSAFASKRVSCDKNFIPGGKDFTGLPLSHLENLRVLKLSSVGGFVSGTTLKVGFQRHTKLRSLTILQEPRLLISPEEIKGLTDTTRISVHYEHSRLNED